MIFDWFKAMESDDVGMLILSNIKHDLNEKRITKSLLKKLLLSVKRHWKGIYVHSAVDLLLEIIIRNPELYTVKGRPLIKESNQCSRIMDANSFWQHNVRKSKWPCATFSSVPPYVLEELENNGIGSAAKGKMRGRLPFAWVTKSNSIATNPSCSYICSGLVLEHYFDGRFIVIEIVYPLDFSKTNHIRPPTFMDGISTTIYRSTKKSDKWGRAVDLSNGNDGLPEAVHEETPFTNQFSIRRLGKLNAFTRKYTYANVVSTHRTPWNCTYDANKIMKELKL
jgi:hypothetical protein